MKASDFKECQERGLTAQEEFKTSIGHYYDERGIKYRFGNTTESMDINDHVDIVIEVYNEERQTWLRFTVDVKDRKYFQRSDKQPAIDGTWIELKNVHGKEGWLHGKEDYLAFKAIDYPRAIETFIIVRRTELQKLVRKNCTDTKIYNEPLRYYRRYRREGRRDESIFVPFTDLRRIALCEIPAVSEHCYETV